jgi:hypothetical protein
VTGIPANLPWVQDGTTGLLFDCGQSSRLAEALARAMDDVALRRQVMGTNRRRIEQEADMKRNMETLALAFERVVLETRGRSESGCRGPSTA